MAMKKPEVLFVLLGCGAGFCAAWYFLFGFFPPSPKLASSPVVDATDSPISWLPKGWLPKREPDNKQQDIQYHAPIPSLPERKPDNEKRDIQYHVEHLPTSVVYRLVVPAQANFVVTPAISETVATIEQFAQETGSIGAINAGFFDPENQLSTSYVTMQGRLVADPTLNPRLVNNPALTAYLPKIFDRSEFRRYQCGQEVRYDIALHSAPVPQECQLLDAIGGGPQLLPKNTAVAEGFVSYENGVLTRDPLGSNQLNARSAIGITSKGDIVLTMVQQLQYSPDSGLSLAKLTKTMEKFGVKKALNLDGGSSASFYYLGETVYGKRDVEGKPVQRPVKSVLLIKENL
jgi:hypothetical protein